ncbi:MAG TPA: HAD family hydrolase [Euzebyales bacterium]|nr:HAD family hydrolase [Euzebyales bacterium]
MRPTLEGLREAGLTVVVAGNQPARRRRQLVDLGLPADVIATSDDLGVDKPAPGYFARVCALAGAPPERVLHVGDRVDNDVVPARHAGLRTAWLRRGPWGLLQRPPVDGPPDLMLVALSELADHLGVRA